MADTVVRPTTADDVAVLVEIFDGVAGEGRWIAREHPFDRDDAERSIRAGVDDPDRLSLVAEVDGAVAGSLGLQPDGWGHLDLGMFLAPHARGRGVGTRLVEEAVAWARARPGIFKVCLQAWPHNAAALALYRRQGFVVEGYLHRHWRRNDGELWDAVVMGLLLEPADR